MKTEKYLLHKCGHQCLVSLDHNRHFVNSPNLYAMRARTFLAQKLADPVKSGANGWNATTRRYVTSRGKFAEKDSAIAKTDPRV